MGKNISRLLAASAVVASLMMAGGVAEVRAQQGAYPARAIDIIVPYGPGGATDLSARVTAAYLNKRWNVPVNVVNKPGGNTVPASLELYKATPDGYTLFWESANSSSILAVVAKDLPFKVLDRTFVAMTNFNSPILSVPFGSSAKSLKDLEGDIKKNPEQFSWSSLGGSAISDIVIRQYLKAIGVDVSKTKPIVAQSGAQTAAHISGGVVSFAALSGAALPPVMQANLVRPLATTSKTRDPEFKDVPTTAEQGFPSVAGVLWMGISGPPKVPAAVIAKWEQTLKEMLNDAEYISKFNHIGQVTAFKSSVETVAIVKEEIESLKELFDAK